MSRIVVVGSANMDIVARVTQHPRPGETVPGTDLFFIPGGKGANQAVAASRLGGTVSFVGRVGNDSFGSTLAQFLKSEQLNTDLLRASEAPTGTALIVVDEKSENSIVVVAGSNGTVSERDLDGLILESGDLVLSQFEIPLDAIKALFVRARSAGAVTILNPAPARACSPELLQLCDYLVVNEHEVAFFAGQDVAPNTARAVDQARMVAPHRDQRVIVTLGPNGAVLVDGQHVTYMEGHQVAAVDTTAAGDCFVGALAVALADGQMADKALRFANAAAAVSVQKLGASSSLPTRQEVDDFITRTSRP